MEKFRGLRARSIYSNLFFFFFSVVTSTAVFLEWNITNPNPNIDKI